MKNKLTLILAALLLMSCTSCGSESQTQTETTTSGETTTETDTNAEYSFPELNMNGDEFVFLQQGEMGKRGDSYRDIWVETQTGDILDDAIWSRNATIEDKFNVKIVERRESDVAAVVKTAVAAGDYICDVAFPLTYNMGTLITEGILQDLSKISGFQFEQPWWDQDVMADAYVGNDKALYFASSDLTLHNFEMSWCLYFNRRMIEDHQLDLPYDTVKAGKWTFDELYKYISVGANLNGDESWDWNKDGNSVYGFTSMQPDFITQAFVCTGNKQIKFEDGKATLMAGTGNFYDVADKLTKVFGEKGTAFFSNDKTNGSHYEMVFAAGRSMFCAMEIKGGDGGRKFSDMKDDYGIVPMPKYDENDDYVSPVAVWTYFLTIPVTNTKLDETAIILDAMSYLSYRDIVPKYYDVVLQLKHIRDDETSEMLDIIRDSRTYYTAYAFGLGEKLRSSLANAITSGQGGAASIVATYKDSTVAEIDKVMEALNSK